MWRLWLKTRSAALLSAARLNRAVAAFTGADGRPLIVGYHRVVPRFRPNPSVSLPSMEISVAMLEAHVEWIARRYEIVSLDVLGASLESREKRDRPLAAITLDDGYRSAYELAFPLFRRKGIPAAFFVVTDLIGSGGVPLYDRLYFQLARSYERRGGLPPAVLPLLGPLRLPAARLERVRRARTAFAALTSLLEALSLAEARRLVEALEADQHMPLDAVASLRCMDWPMLRRMVSGGMAIGSHTRSHVLLTREPESLVKDEAAGSKRRIEQELGQPVHHFAYPSGEFVPHAVRAVASAGYHYAYTICSHVDPAHPLLTIPRKVLWERSCVDRHGRFAPAVMEAQASGFFDVLSPPCALDHGPIVRPVLAAAAAS